MYRYFDPGLFTTEQKMQMCYDFTKKLAALLSNDYSFETSPFSPMSAYLIPKGHENENTWTSKPEQSFRCSDHWNWYAHVSKCPNVNYIQCKNVHAYYPRKRPNRTQGTIPRKACQVAAYGFGSVTDISRVKNVSCYAGVYGEIYDRAHDSWYWLESDPQEVVDHLFGQTK